MTLIEQEPDTNLETGTSRPKHAHIVRVRPGESAINAVYMARMYGYAVEALCGIKFVPQQDPTKLPPCTECKEIFEMHKAFGGFEGEPRS